MTERRFRLLLTLYIVFALTAGGASLLPGGYSETLRLAYEAEPKGVLDRHTWVLIAVAIPLFAAIVLGIVGLYRFKNWGRALSLYSTLTGVALLPLLGPTLVLPLEDALWEASTLLWGALLSAAYFSPISARFRPNNSSKPTPLRGAA